MATNDVKGIVKFVGPVVFSGAENKFRKRDLILTTDYEGDYPQTIIIEAAQDRCDEANLNEVIPGDIVTVSYSLRGREWVDPKTGLTKVFNTLSYWKMAINKTTAGKVAGAPPVYAAPAPPAANGFGPPASMTPTPAQGQPVGYTADQLPDPNALPF